MKKIRAWLPCVLAALVAAASADESASPPPRGAGIDISELISTFARRSGRAIVLDPRVHVEVPLANLDAASITHDQLLAVLDVNQLVMVDAGGVTAVVPDTAARQVPSPVYTDVDFKAADYQIVNLLVTPKKVCAALLVPVLRPLMPQAAHLAAEVQTNTLIINDRAMNARRIATMIGQLDKLGTTSVKDCQQPTFGSKG